MALVGGCASLCGLGSLYYDVALITSFIGIICAVFAGIAVELGVRKTAREERMVSKNDELCIKNEEF